MSILNKLKLQLKLKAGDKKKKKGACLTTWRIITMIITTILIIGIFSTFYFAYNNIYLTLANAHSIFLLELNMGEESVDGDGYEKAKIYIEQKKDKIILNGNLRNVFEYDTSTTSPKGIPSVDLETVSTTTLEVN